jgi:hypothetical protein
MRRSRNAMAERGGGCGGGGIRGCAEGGAAAAVVAGRPGRGLIREEVRGGLSGHVLQDHAGAMWRHGKA